MPVSNRSQVIEQLARRVRAIECGVGREALTSRVCQASRTDEPLSQSDYPIEESATEEPGQPGERGRTGATDDGALPTGIGPLDDRLPEGGLPAGSLMEWLGPIEGGGAGTLLFLVARHRLQAGGVGIVIDRDRQFYPPATGFSDEMLARTIVLRPGSDGDTLWALEQSLRCPGVAFVVCRLDRVQPNAYRRLKLAAETGGGLGLFPREERCRSQSSWADLRLLVEPVSTEIPPLDKGGPGGVAREAFPLPVQHNSTVRQGSPSVRRRSPSVRRGSPDPAETADRRSPLRTGDLRSHEVRGRETRAQQGETRAQQTSTRAQQSLATFARTPPNPPLVRGGTLFNPAPPFSPFRFPLSALPPESHTRRLRLHILHHRGRAAGDVIELEIDYETGDVRTAPTLAAATHPLRAAGA